MLLSSLRSLLGMIRGGNQEKVEDAKRCGALNVAAHMLAERPVASTFEV